LPRAKWALVARTEAPSDRALEKIASRELLDGPNGSAIRRAVEERVAILAIVASLPKADRALLPDVGPTVNGLVERVVHLARALQRLDQGIDPRQLEELDARIDVAARASDTPDGERRLSLLRRQRATLDDLVQRRTALARQMDNVGLALGNLRLDLIKLRSSGVQAALSDVSTATQEARALSREIGLVLETAAELKGM
jgi:serine/threonine-protein kinase